MRNPVLTLRNLPGGFPWMSKLLASSLLLGLVGTVGTTLTVQPVTAKSVEIAQAGNAPVNQRLVGQWQAKVSQNQSLTFIFAPDGKLFIVLPSSSQTASALQLRYRVASTAAKPMQLDLTTGDNKTAQTIFEFTPQGKLRMELQGIDAGKPRPSTFGKGAMTFDKTSNAATLPANARITETKPGNILPK